ATQSDRPGTDSAMTSLGSFDSDSATEFSLPHTDEGDAPTAFHAPAAGGPDGPTGFSPSPIDAGAGAETRGPVTSVSGSPADSGAPRGPLAIGQSFGPRYHIIRELGVGGMGAVYHAWDEELGMSVALKVIRPEATADHTAARELERRFKQELVLARQVT